MKIINGIVLNENGLFDKADIEIEKGTITSIVEDARTQKPGKDVIDARGCYVVPGFIDIHFHGAMGMDAMDARPESIHIMSEFCAKQGVTSFYPTTWSASPEDILEAIDCVKSCKDSVKGAQILGVHIEGPYLDKKFRGAQLPEMVRLPDPTEYHAWFDTGIVKIITCAPELEGCSDFINESVKHGVRISIGHSNATYEQVISAAGIGASQATHIFNGMVGLHHREPGTVGGILDDDRLLAQVICDGVHLHPAVIRLILAVKTTNRIVLITDSVRGTGLADGDYEHKGQRFSVRDGVARTPEGGLSGSTLTLDQALRNFIAFTGVSVEEALKTVTLVPALEMGIADRKGIIKAGYDADLVFLDQNLQVQKTIINGKIVYSKE